MKNTTFFITLSAILLFSCLHRNAAAQVTAPILTSDTIFIQQNLSKDLNPYLLYYRTPFKNLNEDSVLHHYNQGEFMPWRSDRFKQFYNDDQYWFSVQLQNSTSDLQNLLLSFTGKGYTVTIYEYDHRTNALIKTDSSSIHASIEARPKPLRLLTFPVEIKESSTKHLFLKVQKTMVRNTLFKFKLSNQYLYLQSELKEHLLIFMFIGFFAIALVFHLFLFLVFKEPLHGWQTSYIFVSLIFVLYLFDFHVYLFSGKVYEIASSIPTVVLPYLSVLALMGVYMNLLQTHRYLFIHKMFQASMAFCVFTICCSLCSYVLYFILPESQFRPIDNLLRIPTFLNFLLYAPTFFISSIYLIFRVSNPQKFFLAVIFISISFWLLAFTETAGKTDIVIVPPNNMVAAHVIEIGAFMLLTIYSFWGERVEKISLLETKLSLQKQLVADVVEAQEQERKRIAQELHDGVGGFLGALRMMVNRKRNVLAEKGNTESTEILAEVQHKLDTAITDVREISHNLMPSDFDIKDFSHILKDHLIYINEHGNITFEYYIDEVVNQFPKPLLISLYRIAMELIRNIQKHAGATKATIQLIVHSDTIQLQVEDNGKGMKESKSNGIGLASIESRVKYHNGKLTTDTSKLGTTFIIEIPVVQMHNS